MLQAQDSDDIRDELVSYTRFLAFTANMQSRYPTGKTEAIKVLKSYERVAVSESTIMEYDYNDKVKHCPFLIP
jgi:hypothetical protein